MGNLLALEIYEKFGGRVEIYNEYGPTEAAVGCSIQRFDAGGLNRKGNTVTGSVPIGKPINNAQLYILDNRLSCAPIGVGGEVEASILHGCANKYHDGFLGHSYVCPWVNLGAMTTNSDLKNDYSDVSVPLTGQIRQMNRFARRRKQNGQD